MYCRNCSFPLPPDDAGQCPRCGTWFHLDDDLSYKIRLSAVDRLRGLKIGLPFTIIMGVIAGVTLLATTQLAFGSKEAALLWHLGVAAVFSGGGAVYAAWSQSLAVRALLVPGCICYFWLAFVAGVGAWFYTWQSGPNPPDEAFNDTGALGAVIVGWVPAVLVVGSFYGLTAVVVQALRRR